MEHKVFDEKHECPNCDSKEMVTGKIYGVELVDWNGHKLKVSFYYDYCSKCNYYKIIQ